MLKHGLGRAVLFLKNASDTTKGRTIIQRACHEDWRFDRQLEQERAPYLFDIVHATGEPDWYIDHVTAVLETVGTSQESERTNHSQLFTLAFLFTQNGDRDLRDPIYRAIERIAHLPYALTNRTEIIAMDGIEGYRFLVEQLIKHPLSDEEKSSEVWLLEELFEQQNERLTNLSLDLLTGTHPRLAPYLGVIRKQRKQKQRERIAARERRRTMVPAVPPTDAEIRAYLDSPEGVRRSRPKMRLATQNQRAELAEELAAQTIRERQIRYLELLGGIDESPFFGDPEILIALIRQTNDDSLAWRATSALQHTSAPEIRAAAREFLQTEKRYVQGGKLLTFNPGEDDAALFADLLTRGGDDDQIHWVGHAVGDYAKKHNVSEIIPVLLDCYEKVRCSFCRRNFVETLMERDALPLALRAECQYDANSSIRTLVQSNCTGDESPA